MSLAVAAERPARALGLLCLVALVGCPALGRLDLEADCKEGLHELPDFDRAESTRRLTVARRVSERDCVMWRRCVGDSELLLDRRFVGASDAEDRFWELCPARLLYEAAQALSVPRSEYGSTAVWREASEACRDREFETCREWQIATGECPLYVWRSQ